MIHANLPKPAPARSPICGTSGCGEPGLHREGELSCRVAYVGKHAAPYRWVADQPLLSCGCGRSYSPGRHRAEPTEVPA